MISQSNKIIWVCALIFIFNSSSNAQNTTNFPFTNTSLSTEERVNDLVNRMTLKEKISQMVHNAVLIERLGVPAYNWSNECLHGIGRVRDVTVFPEPIGMAASFDDSLVFQMADLISDEARARYHFYQKKFAKNPWREEHQGLTFWSPNINIFRDPRWGRGMETYGEDPWLTSRMGVAYVKGLQGNNPKYYKVIATPKHFVAHSGPEKNRHQFNTKADQFDLLDTYTPAFKAAVQEGKAYSVMCAYNRLNGKACCGDGNILNGLLRTEWGFNGYVVSDCEAIDAISRNHKLVKTLAEAAALAVKSGDDLSCSEAFKQLEEAVNKNLIVEEEINISVKRLFTARFKLGMFDPDEQNPYSKIPISVVESSKHMEISKKLADKTMTLLKNEGNLLPLSKEVKSILICGPNADAELEILGNYTGYPKNITTPLKGIKEKIFSNSVVYYTPGCGLLFDVAYENVPIEIFKNGATEGLKAEYFNNEKLKGEPALVKNTTNINFNLREGAEVVNGIYNTHWSVRYSGEFSPEISGDYYFQISGDDGYRLFIDSVNVVDLWKYHSLETREGKISLVKGKKYKFKLEYFQGTFDGTLNLKWQPAKTKEELSIPFKKTMDLATKADVILFFGGLSPFLEGEEIPEAFRLNGTIPGFEDADRTTINLPTVQSNLLKSLKKLGKPIVLVLMNGGALAINWEKDNIPAIIEAWYPGQMGGKAIADVLFGETNPAGRLPVTFYKSDNDLPPFTDYSMKNRTYRYFNGTPLFPFGYGLSYTKFKYSSLKLDKLGKLNEPVTVSVLVANIGAVDGDEVVQLYIKDLQATVKIPNLSLQGFERINLKPGQSKMVEFKLSPEQFSILNKDLKRETEAGLFEISVGGCQPLPGFVPPSTEYLTGKIELK